MAAPPPSKPDRQFSRIRLSSRWVLYREGAALRLVPKSVGQAFGITQANCTRLIPPPVSPRGHSCWFVVPSFCPSHFHLPAFPSLHGRYPLLSYYGRSDSRQPGTRTVGPSHPPALAGLPGFCTGASVHSISNHRRDDRRPSGCQRICARPDRLRLSLEVSPVHADRIEFTAAVLLDSLCYGLVVLVSMLSPRIAATQLRFDTARFFTAQERTSTALSHCHPRRTSAGFSPLQRAD